MYMKLAKPIIVLTLICVISSALLGATYTITKDTIDAATKAATDAAMAAVLPGAGSVEEITGDGVEGGRSARGQGNRRAWLRVPGAG